MRKEITYTKDGQTYTMHITIGERAKRVKASEFGYVIENGKIYCAYNHEFNYQRAGFVCNEK